jgi:hypothetical protein
MGGRVFELYLFGYLVSTRRFITIVMGACVFSLLPEGAKLRTSTEINIIFYVDIGMAKEHASVFINFKNCRT